MKDPNFDPTEISFKTALPDGVNTFPTYSRGINDLITLSLDGSICPPN